MALWGLIPAALQTVVGIAGMAKNAKKNKKYLDLDNIGDTSNVREYKVGGDFMNAISTLKSESEKGYSDSTKASVDQGLEDTRRSEVALAKETSGGSSANAFNRSIGAGIRKSQSYGDFMRGDENLRLQKLGSYVAALNQLDSTKFAAHSTFEGQKMDQQRINLAKYSAASGEQNSWGGAVAAGIGNAIGSIESHLYKT